MRSMPVITRLAVRAVLQEHAAASAWRGWLGLRVVQHLEALDVALVLQDARDLGLQARRGHVDARVPAPCVALRIRVSMSAIGSVIFSNLVVLVS